jgi:hypothetical protein
MSSAVKMDRFEFDGWYAVLCRKGTRMDLITLILPAVEPFAANLANSASSVRNVAQSGSRDVGCGIVTLVSAVDWETFSDVLLAVVASVSNSVSTDEARCDEVRDVAELTLLYEAFFVTAGETRALVGVEDEEERPQSELLVAAGLPTCALAGAEEEFLENTLWGFCFILVRYTLARFKARLVLLGGSAEPVAPLPAWNPGVALVLDVTGISSGNGQLALRGLSEFLVGEGDLDLEIQDRFAKSAKDSTAFGPSKDFPASMLPDTPATFCLANLLDWCSCLARTLGLNFELGSQERGRSTIDLLLVRLWPVTALKPAALPPLSPSPSPFSNSICAGLSVAVAGL